MKPSLLINGRLDAGAPTLTLFTNKEDNSCRASRVNYIQCPVGTKNLPEVQREEKYDHLSEEQIERWPW